MTYDALPASKDAQRRNLGHFIYKDFALTTPPLPIYLSPSEQFAIEVEEIFQKNSNFQFSFRGKNGNYPKNQFWIVQLIPTKEGHGLIMSEA